MYTFSGFFSPFTSVVLRVINFKLFIMKKITLKTLLFLFIATCQMYAQVNFQENTAYRLRTALASPEDYNTSKDAPFPGQFVYPTIRPGQNSLTVTPKDSDNNNLQLFQFSPLSGQMIEYPEGSGEMKQIYNIVTAVTGDGTAGTGVLELNEIGVNGQRIRLKGNAYPFNDDLAKFIVVPVSTTATETFFQIIAAGTIGIENGANRVVGPDTNYEWLNYGGPGGTVRPQFEEWVFEDAAGSNVLDNEEFNTSSIFISNPVNSEIIIKGLDNKVNKIEVFNLVGKSILQKDVKGNSSLRIGANSLTSGLYFVKLYGETSTFTKKIIKQ